MSRYQPSLGYVYVWSNAPEHHVLMLLGDTTPGPKKGSASYGGWENVKRARKRSLKEWAGIDGLVLEIPFMIDQFAQSGNIEPLITELEKMAGRTRPGAPETEPPLVQFNSGGVIPHDYHRDASIEWVIEDIEWGDADRPEGSPNRCRQAGVLIVGEYIEDDDLVSLTSAQRRKLAKAKSQSKKGKAQKKANQKRYVCKNGDTLESIAAKELGSSSRWHEIKARNPAYRDPTKPIPAGTILNMP